jgi:hypothetical protein
MGAPKKVAIYSEGFGSDTKVINEDGTVVDGVYSANIMIEAGNFVKVELILNAPAVNIQGATVAEVQLSCSICGGLVEHTCP